MEKGNQAVITSRPYALSKAKLIEGLRLGSCSEHHTSRSHESLSTPSECETYANRIRLPRRAPVLPELGVSPAMTVTESRFKYKDSRKRPSQILEVDGILKYENA